LCLRKQLKSQAGELTDPQRKVAEERTGQTGNAIGSYNAIKKILGAYKGQCAFVSSAYEEYSPDDLNKIQVFNIVKNALAKVSNE